MLVQHRNYLVNPRDLVLVHIVVERHYDETQLPPFLYDVVQLELDQRLTRSVLRYLFDQILLLQHVHPQQVLEIKLFRRICEIEFFEDHLPMSFF